MQPIIITQELLSDSPSEVQILSHLINEFHCRIHIRKKNCSIGELDTFCRALSEHVDPFYLTLHGHVDLVERYSFGGVHDKSREGLSGNKLFSMSCHSMKEAEVAACDYLFLSPIFDSISKQGYQSPYNMEELQAWLHQQRQHGTDKKIIALGGINKHNISEIHAMGFDGAALLGSVWNEHNAIENYKIILKNL